MRARRQFAGFDLVKVNCPTCGGSGLVACATNHPQALKGYTYPLKGDATFAFEGPMSEVEGKQLGVKLCGHCRGKGYHEQLPATVHTSVQPGSTRVQ